MAKKRTPRAWSPRQPGKRLNKLSDGESGGWRARRNIGRDAVSVIPYERSPVQLPQQIHCFLAIVIIRTCFEWAIEKSTEIGAVVNRFRGLRSAAEKVLVGASEKRAARG